MLKKNPVKNENKKIEDLPVKKLSELSNLNSFVIYGRAGTGKTTLAGTFPTPILLLDVKDRGTDSLDEDSFDGDIMEVKSWDDFEMTYWWLKKTLRKGACKYKTVVIDTVSQLQNLALAKILEDKGKDASKAGDWGTATKQDWGTLSSMMKQALTNMRDLPNSIKVVAIAQDRTFNDGEESGVDERISPLVGPRLSPSVASHLNAEFSIIGNTFIQMKTQKVKLKSGKVKEKEVPEYYLRIGPNPVYITKVRKSKHIPLPAAIEDPTYDKIMDTLKPKK